LQQAGLVSEAAGDPASAEHAYVQSVIALLKDRMKQLTEVVELTSFFFTDETEAYDATLLIPKKTEPSVIGPALERVEAILADADFDDEEAMQASLDELLTELGLKRGQLYMAIRVAITGRTVSPGLFETLRVLGKARTMVRIQTAREKLAASLPSLG
jgi:glutamyl-tRNA synthetase